MTNPSSITADEADEALIREAQNGDAQAFERLLDQYYELIYRVAFRWSGCQADAEDITQLACIKLAKSVGQFRAESAFSSWLYRLVINCAKDWGKAQKRHQHEGDDVFNQIEDHKAGKVEQSVFLDQVLALLDDMAEGFKETALLVFAEGCSHKEVAEVLGVKENTISWRIHEIRKLLEASLSEVAR